MVILFSEAFANYFSKYGDITDSVIMIDKHSGRPRGFGFVTFSDPAVADKVLAEDHVIDGRMVTFEIPFLTCISFPDLFVYHTFPLGIFSLMSNEIVPL